MIVDAILAPARFILDRAWFALARLVIPLDDNLVDIGDHDGHDCVDAECSFGFVPAGHNCADANCSFGFVPVATFDGKAIGERLDCDITR